MGSHVRSWLLLVVGMSLLLGCSGADRPTVYPVTGKVTYKGKPIAGVQITFTAKDAARAAIGVTDAQGVYHLTTFDTNDGAVPGTHTVTISKQQLSKEVQDIDIESADPSDAYGEAMAAAAEGKSPTEAGGGDAIPAKYGSADTSGLERKVTAEGPNEFNIDLK